MKKVVGILVALSLLVGNVALGNENTVPLSELECSEANSVKVLLLNSTNPVEVSEVIPKKDFKSRGYVSVDNYECIAIISGFSYGIRSSECTEWNLIMFTIGDNCD